MLFSHARQGPVVCLAMSQSGVNASLVMSPLSVEEQERRLGVSSLNPWLFQRGEIKTVLLWGQKATEQESNAFYSVTGKNLTYPVWQLLSTPCKCPAHQDT